MTRCDKFLSGISHVVTSMFYGDGYYREYDGWIEMSHNVLSAICGTKLVEIWCLNILRVVHICYGVSHVVTLTLCEIGTIGSKMGGSKCFTMC